jgi:hypothetical protein
MVLADPVRGLQVDVEGVVVRHDRALDDRRPLHDRIDPRRVVVDVRVDVVLVLADEAARGQEERAARELDAEPDVAGSVVEFAGDLEGPLVGTARPGRRAAEEGEGDRLVAVARLPLVAAADGVAVAERGEEVEADGRPLVAQVHRFGGVAPGAGVAGRLVRGLQGVVHGVDAAAPGLERGAARAGDPVLVPVVRQARAEPAAAPDLEAAVLVAVQDLVGEEAEVRPVREVHVDVEPERDLAVRDHFVLLQAARLVVAGPAGVAGADRPLLGVRRGEADRRDGERGEDPGDRSHGVLLLTA